MIRKAHLEYHATMGESISVLFGNFLKMNLIKTNLPKRDKIRFSENVGNISMNGTTSELINFIKKNILIQLPSDQENQKSLKERLQQHGLKPEDRILIYDICSHSGRSMNAVTEAFKSIGYNNLNPVVMNPPLNSDDRQYYPSLTNHVSIQTCYPFSIAQSSSTECLSKPPNSLTCEIREPRQLQEDQREMYSLIKTYLAKHH